jgi:hypothetical protein
MSEAQIEAWVNAFKDKLLTTLPWAPLWDLQKADSNSGD